MPSTDSPRCSGGCGLVVVVVGGGIRRPASAIQSSSTGIPSRQQHATRGTSQERFDRHRVVGPLAARPSDVGSDGPPTVSLAGPQAPDGILYHTDERRTTLVFEHACIRVTTFWGTRCAG